MNIKQVVKEKKAKVDDKKEVTSQFNVLHQQPLQPHPPLAHHTHENAQGQNHEAIDDYDLTATLNNSPNMKVRRMSAPPRLKITKEKDDTDKESGSPIAVEEVTRSRSFSVSEKDEQNAKEPPLDVKAEKAAIEAREVQAKKAELEKQKKKIIVPQFYFPFGPLPPKDAIQVEVDKLAEFFSKAPTGLKIDALRAVTKVGLGLPKFFARILFNKIDVQNTGLVTYESFMQYWKENIQPFDKHTRFFNVLKQKKNNFIVEEDFKVMLLDLLETHPGLEFLKSSPEFQTRYLETVVVRIFYKVNRSGSGHISLTELRKSNFMEVTLMVDDEPDINKVLNYYSYEHFYVLYCKFWELDQDHDLLIDKDDLSRYGNYAIVRRAIERVFTQYPKKFVSKVDGKMSYKDFIWFLLCEEDKHSPTAQEYWFRAIDIDEDGIISTYEIEYYYEEQAHRMECLSYDTPSLTDMVCQLNDMIRPRILGTVKLADIRKSKLSSQFFNMLLNLNKFVAQEQKDVWTIREEHANPHLTDWDRFCRFEYDRLSMEEEEEEEEEPEEQAESTTAYYYNQQQTSGGGFEAPF